MATEAREPARDRTTVLRRVAKALDPSAPPGSSLTRRTAAVARTSTLVGVGVGGTAFGAATLGPLGVHEAAQLITQAQPAIHAASGFGLAAGLGAGAAFVAQPIGLMCAFKPDAYYQDQPGNRAAVHSVVRRVGITAVAVTGGLSGAALGLAAAGHGGADPALLDIAGSTLGISLGALIGNATLWRHNRSTPSRSLGE